MEFSMSRIFTCLAALILFVAFTPATASAQTFPNTWASSTPSTLPWYCGSTPKFTSRPFVAENGSFYGQRNSNYVPKTVYVAPYCRSNGTRVSGHYRSAPNTNPRRR